MANRPLRIGVAACFFHADPQRAIFKGKTLVYAEQSMCELLMRHGAITYMLPDLHPPFDAEAMVADLDGLLLQGGSDVAPGTYGEEPLRPEWSGDAIRDAYEAQLLRAAIEMDRPVLGICRGIQLANAALGGTLYQDINTQKEGTLVHRNWEIYDQNFHTVEFPEGSYLRKLYGGASGGKTNSVHHQAIKQLAPGFVVEALSDADGIIEAIRYAPQDQDNPPYILGIQWHPEFITPADTSLLSPDVIALDFLQAVQQRAQGR